LALLGEAWQAAREGHALLVVVEGPAGIGKSWLARSFRTGLEAAPYVASTPFLSVALRASAHLLAGEREASFLAAAHQVAPGGPWAQVPGEADWAPDREGVRTAIAGALARVARARGGLCLVAEDVHAWSEDDRADLRAFWRYWGSARAAVLILATARPAEVGAEPGGWLDELDAEAARAAVTPPQRIELWPLAESETTALILSALAAGEAPAGLSRWLQERSGGHPLHAQELLRFLLEGGALSSAQGVWSFRPPGAEAVPGDLEATLRRRLGRVRGDPEMWRALVALGALDRSVEVTPWSRICGIGAEGLGEIAARAIELGLARLELRQGQATYALAHPLYPPLVRALTDRAQLKEMHLRIAQTARFPGERARHGRLAGHPEAGEWTRAAIADAQARFAHAEVAAHASALAVTTRPDENLLVTWAGALFQLGRFDEALEALSARTTPRAARLRVQVLTRKGGSSDALNEANASVDRHPDDHELRLQRAGLLVDEGRLEEAERELRALLRAASDRDAARAGALLARGRWHRARGDWKGALRDAGSAVRRLRRLPAQARASLPSALAVLGEIALGAGRADQAEEALRESVALAEARGERSELARRHLYLGRARLDLGKQELAAGSLGEAARLASSIGDVTLAAEARRTLLGAGQRPVAAPADPAASRSVYLRTLGAFGLQEGDRAVRWRARKVRDLLALLMIAALREDGPAVARERAVGTLWPESPPDRAEASFRAALKRLRAVLGGAARVERDAHGAYFLSGLRADVIFFQDAVQRGDRVAAATWYHGEFLPGVDLPGADVIRERLRGRFRELAHALAAESPAPQASHLYERLLDDDPFDLSALQGLARTLRERGEAGRLARRLRAAASHARAELGEVPAELIALLDDAGLEP
jgi:DNA-binding SARP family transcriptional activator